MTDPAEDERVLGLAAAALAAVVVRRWDLASEAVGGIADLDGLSEAIAAWCDTVGAHLCGGLPGPGQRVSLTFANADTGRVSDAASTPPATVWAGLLVAARLAGDKDAYLKLLGSLPRDSEGICAHLGALLDAVVTTMQQVPRGFATAHWT